VDERTLVILVVLGLVGLTAFFVWLAWFQSKRRREAWMAAALELDLRYQREDPGLITRHSTFKLFSLGHSKRARNVLSGSVHGGQVSLADYQYVTGHGKQRTVHSQTLCILTSPRLALPHFFLRRQRAVWDLLGKLFGGQDLNFDEDPAFSKAFVLQGADEAAVRAKFQPGLRMSLMRYEGKSFQLEGRGDTLLFHEGRHQDPAKAREVLERALELLNALA
jgi:hypothetical protein